MGARPDIKFILLSSKTRMATTNAKSPAASSPFQGRLEMENARAIGMIGESNAAARSSARTSDERPGNPVCDPADEGLCMAAGSDGIV